MRWWCCAWGGRIAAIYCSEEVNKDLGRTRGEGQMPVDPLFWGTYLPQVLP